MLEFMKNPYIVALFGNSQTDQQGSVIRRVRTLKSHVQCTAWLLEEYLTVM